jgi:RimJ/RimL family protein N-acetyltransferase
VPLDNENKKVFRPQCAQPMNRPESTWETERLRAKPAACADALVVFRDYASDPVVAKYMTWRPHLEIAETVAFLERCEKSWADGSAFPWTLWSKSGGELVGLVEIRVRPPAVDLGYALTQRWWHQGLMTEALRTVVGWAFAQAEIYRVWATCDIENQASARVLERLGMQREGILRSWLIHPNVSDTPRDAFCYSVVKTDCAE